jgi:hypothetical protein
VLADRGDVEAIPVRIATMNGDDCDRAQCEAP